MFTLQKSPIWEITLARWVLKLQDPNRISLKGAKWERAPICSLSSGALKGRCFEPSLQMRKLRHGEMTGMWHNWDSNEIVLNVGPLRAGQASLWASNPGLKVGLTGRDSWGGGGPDQTLQK